MKKLITICLVCVCVFGLSKVSYADPQQTTHADFDGTVTYWETFMGARVGEPSSWEVKECQTITRGFVWFGWGYDGLYQYIPDILKGEITKQVATYDASASGTGNMGSMGKVLADNGYTEATGNYLMFPAFGAQDMNSPSALNLFTAIDLGVWAENHGTYIWKGDYAFTNGTNALLPGIKVATAEWSWNTSSGWVVDSEYLFTGTATVHTEQGYMVPEPATLCLLGLGTLSLIRRKHNV